MLFRERPIGCYHEVFGGERKCGSLKFLLGLPRTRRNVVFGKFIGRITVISVAILATETASETKMTLILTSFDISGNRLIATERHLCWTTYGIHLRRGAFPSAIDKSYSMIM